MIYHNFPANSVYETKNRSRTALDLYIRFSIGVPVAIWQEFAKRDSFVSENYFCITVVVINLKNEFTAASARGKYLGFVFFVLPNCDYFIDARLPCRNHCADCIVLCAKSHARIRIDTNAKVYVAFIRHKRGANVANRMVAVFARSYHRPSL